MKLYESNLIDANWGGRASSRYGKKLVIERSWVQILVLDSTLLIIYI